MSWTIDCTVCNAPLHVWEYTRHIKSCVVIKIHTERQVVPDALTVHYVDQQLAFQRNQHEGQWTPGWPNTSRG